MRRLPLRLGGALWPRRSRSTALNSRSRLLRNTLHHESMVFRVLLADLSDLLVCRVIPPSTNRIDAVVLVNDDPFWWLAIHGDNLISPSSRPSRSQQLTSVRLYDLPRPRQILFGVAFGV